MSGGMSVADVLSRAADLIEPEGAWTQGASARTADGEDLPKGVEPGAVCWCILGAIGKIVGHPANRLFGMAERALDEVIPSDTIILHVGDDEDDELPLAASWNDAPERTQSEVVAKLREAATLAASVQS